MSKENCEHHKACANLLMSDFRVPKRKHRAEVIELVKQVYHGQQFPHCLIILSVRGFRNERMTSQLRAFLQQHGRGVPKNTKAAMLSGDEY